MNMGLVALNTGDVDGARALIGDALRVFRELGDRHAVVSCAVNAGYVACMDGDSAAADRLFREALDTGRRIGARSLMGYAMLGLAFAATLSGDALRAATLHGAFDALGEELGSAIEAVEARLRDADHARLKLVLGNEAFAAAYRGGRALPLDAAIALAGQEASAPAVPSPGV